MGGGEWKVRDWGGVVDTSGKAQVGSHMHTRYIPTWSRAYVCAWETRALCMQAA